MTASFHLLLPRISSMTEKLSGEAVERRFVMLGQIEPLLGERCQKQARVEFGEATGLGWSAWAAQASDGTDDKVHGIIRAVDPAEWVTGGFVPTFHYYATAEAPDAEFPIFDVDLGLPVGFFETVRRACVDAIADHRPVWLTLKAACDADAPEYRTLAYPPGTILKVTSIELNRSGLRFGDPAGPYPGGRMSGPRGNGPS